MFSNREKMIINFIIEAKNGVFGSALAEKCGTTDRTIRNDIKRINYELAREGFPIQATKNSGYFFSSKDLNNVKKYMNQNYSALEGNYQSGQYIPANAEERLIYITLQLCYASDYTTMEMLMAATYSSRTTIRNDLKKLEEHVEKIDCLSMEINLNKGIRLNGLESKKRVCISKMLSSNFDLNYSYIRSVMGVFVLSSDRFFEIYDLYTTFFDTEQIVFTDKSIQLFTIETLIFMDRYQYGMTLENSYTYHAEASLKLPFDQIATVLKLTIPEQEKLYLLDSLSFKRVLSNSNQYFIEENAHKVVDEFFDTIVAQYHVDLAASEEAKKNFVQHTNSLIQRIRHQVANNQDFIKDIKSMYPYSFELAANIIPIIQKHFGLKIDESELSYIAIHLSLILNNSSTRIKAIIVCSNGLSESQLIELKLSAKFKDRIEIVGTYPLYQLNSLLKQRKDINLIITTLPYVCPIENVSVLQISPSLNAKDFYNFESYLLEMQYGIHSSESLYDGFDPRCFHIYQEKNEQEVLDDMITKLYELHVIDNQKEFLDSVMERENIFPTIYDNIWVPHPLKAMANRTVFSIAIIRETTKINLIILCAIKDGETLKYRDIFNRITSLLTSKKLNSQILSVHDFPEFLEYFNKCTDAE